MAGRRIPVSVCERRRHGDVNCQCATESLDLGAESCQCALGEGALGDQMSISNFLAYWTPTAPPSQQDALTMVTDRPGYLSKDEVIERYASRSGRDVSAIRFYETFALFKIAVVIQQIFYRYKRGQTDDPRFAVFGDRVTFWESGGNAGTRRLKPDIRR